MRKLGIESLSFNRILVRNITLPLVMSAGLCVVFIGLLLNLMSANQQVAHSNRMISETNELFKLVIDSETGLRGFLITGADTYLEPYTRAKNRIFPELHELSSALSDQPDQRERLAKVERDYRDWADFAARAVTLRREGKYRLGQDAELRKDKMDDVREDFHSFLQVAEAHRDIRSDKTDQVTRLVLILTVIFSVVTGAFIALLGRKQLIELSESYEGVLRTQADQNEQLTRQAWLKTGQADVVEKIRGDWPIPVLAERILESLANYLNARLGAFYFLRDDDVLERIGTFAYPQTVGASERNTFKLGEGMVGQAAKDQKLLTLSDVPDDYIRIESALGHTSPKNLVILPLIAGKKTQGVIELGFMESIPIRTIELLSQINEAIGMALKSASYRNRLQELLHESQQLTEELQTQQEELRVSNEELSERTKALQQTQVRLESQHAELEQTNEQLEEQAQLLDNQKHAIEAAREALETKAQELETASRYKSEFLANMSHELRTPLNSSLILAKLLKDNPQGNLTAEQVEFASTIYSAGNDLLTLINDILDISKVEAGKLEIEAGAVSVARVIESLEKTFSPVAKEKKIRLGFTVNPGTPGIIETDQKRLNQILKNIISNALKFTSNGEVHLTVSATEGDCVSFAVRDTGIGIDPSQHAAIFEAFRQADGTTNRRYGGTGLGLSISKSLAELLGGDIQVQSKLGEGSVFSLVIPVKALSDLPKKRNPQDLILAKPVFATKKTAPSQGVNAPPFPDDRDRLPSPGKRSLLIVEDEPHFSKLLYELAHEVGFLCLVAENTLDGYALASKYLPSAVILDMKLPDALGLSLLDRLKADLKTRHIPVHAISIDDYSREALRLGAIGYLQKPADRDELRKTFKKLEEKIAQQIKRVMIVEDDDIQRMSIEKLIGEKGVEISSVGTASDALKNLKTSSFDCMIMDLSLPDLSGYDLLEQMAKDATISFPPVIVYTGRSLSSEEEERLRKYSRTIIIKGARSPERLLDEVTLFLHQVESQLSPEKQRILQLSRHREKSFEGRKILLVDDDVRNIFALTSALEQKGAQVLIARNGREAIEKLDAHPETDLVLMDIMMPEMDGYEAMQRIRQQERFTRLPIIAITAKAMRDDYEKCLKAGANDYLAKPIELDQLVSLMRVWLPKEIG